MNVALTRAKHCLMVIGDGKTLMHEKQSWLPLLNHCLNQNSIKTVWKYYKLNNLKIIWKLNDNKLE